MTKKILIIDDNPELVTILKMRLEKEGYPVVSAEDGMMGLKKAKEERPDLILLDVLMPNMDGFSFLLELRKVPELASLPVIVLTAKKMMGDLFKLEGVRDYILKPFDKDDLLAKVKRYI